jgi:hypothetical protein
MEKTMKLTAEIEKRLIAGAAGMTTALLLTALTLIIPPIA